MRILYIPRNITPVKTIPAFGFLYNWWAAIDARKITSSDDWVVPTGTQWNSLRSYVSNLALNLRETGTTYWISPNDQSTNSLGFNSRGAGLRLNTTGAFANINKKNNFMSVTVNTDPNIYTCWIDDQATSVNFSFGQTNKKTGSSIRLLYVGAGTPTEYIGNDSKSYRIVQINGKYYLADNLCETQYRNGDWITGSDGGIYTAISNAAWAASTTEMMCAYNDDLNNALIYL